VIDHKWIEDSEFLYILDSVLYPKEMKSRFVVNHHWQEGWQTCIQNENEEIIVLKNNATREMAKVYAYRLLRELERS